MQEKYNEEAQVELDRQQERNKLEDEAKRRQKIEEWERLQQGKGYFSKTARTQEETNDVPTGSTKLKPKDST